LLRPIDDTGSQTRIRDLILAAYAEYETDASTAVSLGDQAAAGPRF
jgi:hypothetical protein